MDERVDDGDGHVVTRRIPVPTSISPQARAVLAGAGALSPAAMLTNPPLDDVEGWRARIAAGNDMVLAMLEPRIADVRAEVERRTIAGVPVFVVTPEGVDPSADAPILLDVHGGALIMGFGECCRVMATDTAAKFAMRTWAVDYRMPPDHPYPAGLDDCLAVYRHVLEEFGAERIVLEGASAGGNLAAALVLRARDEGLPLPAALVLLSPEVDLTESGDSFATNLGLDTVLTRSLADQNALYAGGHDLTHPYVSPLFGDLRLPFPPTFVQAGTRDLFLSNAVRLHRTLRAGGVDAELHVFEAMPHGGFWGAPEDQDLDAELRRFVAAHTGGPPAR